jgi:hypothetical protein
LLERKAWASVFACDELDPGDVVLDHPVDRVPAAATHTDDLDGRS